MDSTSYVMYLRLIIDRLVVQVEQSVGYVCDRPITFEQNDLWPRYFARCLILFRSSWKSHVKVWVN